MQIVNLSDAVPPDVIVELPDVVELAAHADAVILFSLGQLCVANLSIYLMKGDEDAKSSLVRMKHRNCDRVEHGEHCKSTLSYLSMSVSRAPSKTICAM